VTEKKTLDEMARAAGRNLWLAGVGAVAALGEAGGRLFDELVEKGERFEKHDLRAVRERLDRLGDDAKRLGDKVGAAVEERVEAGLERLGVPSREDVHKLATRIEQLNQKIDRLAAERA
jgi:poly(hydroxyalkanoate) granule-associated protein